jgi:hypothetical protein
MYLYILVRILTKMTSSQVHQTELIANYIADNNYDGE